MCDDNGNSLLWHARKGRGLVDVTGVSMEVEVLKRMSFVLEYWAPCGR